MHTTPTRSSRSPRRLRLAGLAALLALLLVAPPVAASSPLDGAKAAGWVGERPDGYVGLVRADAPAEVRALIRDVNARRAASYEEIARDNGTTPVAVAILAGRKLIERAPPGHHVMDDQGRWTRKR